MRLQIPALAATTALIMCGSLIASSPAYAAPTILYVAPNGSDDNECTSNQKCKTITHAVSKAPTGSTIEIASGTYTEDNLVLDKSVTLKGATPSTSSPRQLLNAGILKTIVKTSNPGAGPVITITGSSNSAISIMNVALEGQGNQAVAVAAPNDLAIDTVSFERVAATGSIIGIDSTDSPIRGFSLTDSAIECSSRVGGYGVIPTSGDGVGHPVTVSNNYLTNCGAGINAGNFAGFGSNAAVAGTSQFSNNEMDTMGWSCIHVAMSFENLQVANNTLTDCNMDSNPQGAVSLEALTPATSVTASGNTITSTQNGSRGEVGVQIQNVPASPGNLAKFVVERNFITELKKSGSSDAIRLGPTAIARAADDIDIDILSNTLTNNSRGGSWQTNAGSSLQNNLDFTSNRIANNSSRGFSVFSSSRTLNAQNNWWGCNDGPSDTQPAPGAGCDSVGGGGSNTLNLSPHLVMTMDSSPQELPTGESAAIKTRFTKNSDGQTVSGIPNGTDVSLSTTIGVIETATNTVSGIASANFTAPFTTGSGQITATLDSQEVNRSIDIVPSTVEVSVNVPSNIVIGKLTTFTFHSILNGAPAPVGSTIRLRRSAVESRTLRGSSSTVCTAVLKTPGSGQCKGKLPAGKWKLSTTFAAPNGPAVTPNATKGLSKSVTPSKAKQPARTKVTVKRIGKRVRFVGQTRKPRTRVAIFRTNSLKRSAKQVRTLRSKASGKWSTSIRVTQSPTYLCVSIGGQMFSSYRVKTRGVSTVWSSKATRGEQVLCRR